MTEIDRINALTSNARSTWFVLLGALVFVGITLMSVEHIDFYGVDRATTLPIVNFEVPTRYFFFAAPVLIAAIYGYFHLYLIRLWDALSVAEPKHEDRPLGDVITPWLVTDAALHLRARIRADRCTSPRTMDDPAMVLNFLLAWGFGLFILGALWWQSMTAREVWMTAIAGASLSVSLLVGGASLAMAVIRAREPAEGDQVNIFSTAPAMTGLLVLVVAIGAWTNQRTRGSPQNLAPIEMIGEAIVERPPGWLPYGVAKAEYRDAWCARKGMKPCDDLGERESEFERDWNARRAATLADMRRPGCSDPNSNRMMDFRAAELESAFLVGINLSQAKLEEAQLVRAWMEDSDLEQAKLKKAFLFDTRLNGADLSDAKLIDANLVGVDLRGADLSDANFSEASIASVRFDSALMHYVDFTNARLRQNAFFGTREKYLQFEEANFRGAVDYGSAFRFADLTKLRWDENTDLSNSFMDGTVRGRWHMEKRMGRPCQWINVELSKAEFLSVWRWWQERGTDLFVHITQEIEEIPLPSNERIEELGLTGCGWFGPLGAMPGGI